MANAKAANRPPTAPPTTSIAQPISVVNSIGTNAVEAGERAQAEKQRIQDHRPRASTAASAQEVGTPANRI